MNYFWTCLYAFFACIGFCVIFEIHNHKYMIAASLSGAAAWFVYMLLGDSMFDAGKYFIASLVAAILAEVMARLFKQPATVFLVVGIIPLVPGGALYDTMEYLIQGDTHRFAVQAVQTVSYAIAIAVGCSLSASIVRLLRNRKEIK